MGGGLHPGASSTSSEITGLRCKTMNQFACGCPIWFGVALIIFCNAVHNIFFLVCITMNIIFKIPTFGANDPPSAQVFNAAWCLLGLPFIVAAIAGMIVKQESNMRLYLWYLSVTFVMDFVFVLQWLSGDLCDQMPHSLKHHGAAFACGFVRITSVVFTLALLTMFAYSIHTVWSYCEDLKAGGAGRGLPQLIENLQRDQLKNKYDTFANTVSDVGQAVVKPFVANKNKYDGMGGGDRIHFSLTPYPGHYHETLYPPPQKHFREGPLYTPFG